MTWNEKYTNLAKKISTWSKDPNTQIGCVAIGPHGQIVSQGYNGFPRGVNDSEERLHNRELKHKYVVHAEMNCIYNAGLTGTSLEGSTMYVYGLPICHECAKGIIQSGVKEARSYFSTDKDISRWIDSTNLASEMFNEAGVKYYINDVEY